MRLIDHYLTITDLSQVNIDRKSPYPLGTWKGERGDMIYLNCEEQIKMLGVLELRPELGVRGRHAHKTKKEIFYFITGQVTGRYWFEENPDDVREIRHIRGHLVTIEPGLFHEFLALEPSWAVEFSPQTHNDNDTVYPEKNMINHRS
jgi:hypothetical protein